MHLEEIQKYDGSDMFSVLKSFPSQVEDAIRIANDFEFKNLKPGGISNIIVSGLGGSAIGGDYVRSYAGYELPVPMIINRGYNLPAFADENTLVIISSYSGNTEETLSAFKEAIERKCRIVCITSGGEVERIAVENDLDIVKVPGGYQPRCAIGYSFFINLKLLIKLGLISPREGEIDYTIKHLHNLSGKYSDHTLEGNNPLSVAEALHGSLPVIYSSSDILDTVNMRWRGQISENAKVLAYGNFFPEMNHNELVGWKLNEEILRKIVVVSLIDPDDNERVKLRMEITSEIFSKEAAGMVAIESSAINKLGRIMELTYLGDWVSFYLAILNKVDPSPIDVINYLKGKLAG